MKRDMDLIREILLFAEAQTGHWTSSDIEIEGWSREEVSYHIGLLVDKKLLEATCTAFLGRGHSQYFYDVNRLTFDGHDFIDNIRDPKFFNRIKQEATERGIALTLDAVIHLAKKLVREACEGTLWV